MIGSLIETHYHLRSRFANFSRLRKDFLQVSFQLNEVFDVDMVFDSWWFLPDKKMPPKLQSHPKALSLNVPTQGR